MNIKIFPKKQLFIYIFSTKNCDINNDHHDASRLCAITTSEVNKIVRVEDEFRIISGLF